MLVTNLQQMLEKKPHLQNLLFRRGYLFTSQDINVESGYPFYGNWTKKKIKDHYLYVHKDQSYCIQNKNDEIYILVGHAYNPWDSISDENKILEVLINSMNVSQEIFFEELSKITGVFAIFRISGNEIFAVQDSVGIMPIFYTDRLDTLNEIYLSSHSQLIADLCNFTMDANIERLINSKFYLIGIRHLPGIKSPFKKIKTLTANTCLQSTPFNVMRFYPNDVRNILSEQESMETICTILKSSMKLIAEKFNASISLTGGTDSKMTLAATHGLYEKYNYFSFYSSEAEKKDAIAANQICESMGLEHKIYEIPNNNEAIKDFDLINTIINHNAGYVKKHKDAEIRKIAYLYQQNDIELEVKSHVSEIGRGFYYKKHGLKTMPKPLKARHMSNFYKRNMFDRETLKYMDDAFKEFIKITSFGKNLPERYDESDMFYWEHRMSQWAAFVKQDFDISHETTIIYNNRKLLDAFMNFNIKDRIDDIPQRNIIKSLNKELYELNINNENAMKDNKRIFLERVFFEVNSRLP